MAILVWSDDEAALDPALVGTKFATLARIARWPAEDRPRLVPGAALTTEAWYRVVRQLGAESTLTRARAGDGAASHELGIALGEARLPDEVHAALAEVVERLGDGGRVALAVRSSAVAEDLAGRSFAGQYVTRLSITDLDSAVQAYRECLASAWRAGTQAYRNTNGGAGADEPAMAVALQPMVHRGAGWAGAALSDGAGGVIVEAVRGLGDDLMSGRADPLRWAVSAHEQADGVFVRAIVDWVRRAERHQGHAIEVEFAVRPDESVPVVLQLRPHRPSVPQTTGSDRWHSPAGSVNGLSVGTGSVRGAVCRLDGPEQMELLEPGGVLVTSSTDPGWLPLLSELGAVVTDHGGLTSHAAIVCRELGLLAVVGCGDATRRLAHGQQVEVRCDGAAGSVVPLS
jgi:pyruvate,water dikinase